ncbi:MAG: hypothetical protein WBP85_07710 [Terracidiphilus sp.]
MSRFRAIAICAAIAMACAASCALHGQSGNAQAQSGSAASAHDPNLTPLQTVQYIDKAIDQIRIPEGVDTGTITNWPGYFAIEESKGILWWVRGTRTGQSQWEIRYSSAQVNRLDLNALALEVGLGNYETITIPCKPAADGSGVGSCWQNWAASWDDESPELKDGHFNSIKAARVVGNENQQVLDSQEDSVSPLQKQILLLNGSQKQLIDVEPAKPYRQLQVYLGAADTDSAQRMFRALKYLLKKMPAAVTETDPFGP